MTKPDIRRYTIEQIREFNERGDYYHNPDAPEGPELGDEFWKNAVLREPLTSKSVHLKLDPEVFEFFKQQGKGHITRMQNVLAAYVKAQKSR